MNNQNQGQIMSCVFRFKKPSDWQFPSISISNLIIEEGLLKAMDKHVSKLSKRFGLKDITIIGGDSDSFFLSCKSMVHDSKNTLNLMSNPTLASFAFCKKNVSGNSPTNNTYNDIYVSHDSFHANGNPYILLELCIVNRKRPPDDRLCFWIYNYKDPPVIFIIIFSFFFFFLLFFLFCFSLYFF